MTDWARADGLLGAVAAPSQRPHKIWAVAIAPALANVRRDTFPLIVPHSPKHGFMASPQIVFPPINLPRSLGRTIFDRMRARSASEWITDDVAHLLARACISGVSLNRGKFQLATIIIAYTRVVIQ
jgi:hypothetical protein